MKFDLPKTKEIWNKILNVQNTSKYSVEHRKLINQIEAVKQRLNNSESMDEYRSISNELKDLQEQLIALEIEIHTRPVREKEVRSSEVKKLPESYNQEFQPYYDKYLKLDKELKKRLKKFSEDIGPVVKEMKAIENLELSMHMMKLYPENNYGDFIKLPIDTNTLEKTYNFFTVGDFSLTSSVKTIINKIKKFKDVK